MFGYCTIHYNWHFSTTTTATTNATATVVNCTDSLGELPQLWDAWKIKFCLSQLPQIQGLEEGGRHQVGLR